MNALNPGGQKGRNPPWAFLKQKQNEVMFEKHIHHFINVKMINMRELNHPFSLT